MMEVKAKQRGFDGSVLRSPRADEEIYEVFDFDGFKINEDGSNNLGSWMELTKEGEKQFKKAMNAFEKAKAKAEKKANDK